MFLLKCLQNAGNAVLDTQNSKFSRGGHNPNPPSRLVPSALERFAPPKINPAGTTAHIPICLKTRSILLTEAPAGYLVNFLQDT